MDRLFVAFDGDDIGSKVGQSVLMDDIEGLQEISQKIQAAGDSIRDWVESNGGHVISMGGDEGTFIIDSSLSEHLEDLRSHYQQITDATVTLGVGSTLSEAGKSLIAGKLMGKNILVDYDEHVESVLADAHERAQSGLVDKETEKQDEHYLSSLDSDSQDTEEEVSDDNWQDSSDYEDQAAVADTSEENVDEYDMEPSYEDLHDQEDFEEGSDESQSLIDAVTHDNEMDTKNRDSFEDELPAIRSPEEDSENLDDEETDFTNEKVIKIPENKSVDRQKDPEEMIAQAVEGQGTSEDEGAFEDEMSTNSNVTFDDSTEGQDQSFSPDLSSIDEKEAANQQPKDLDLLSELLADAGSSDELKSRVATILEKFKANKDIIFAMRDQNPEMYSSILLMLKQMIDMVKQLAPSTPEEDNPEKTLEEESPEEPSLPKTMGR